MKVSYHRCPECFWTIKTSSDFEKVVTCPYDTCTMTKFDDVKMSIFSNQEEHIAKGMPGYYSLALGRIVSSKYWEEKEMRKRGFVKESELVRKHGREDYVDYQMELAMAREEEIDRLTNIYKQALEEGKTQEEAVAIAFNTEDALSGKLQKLFNPTGETHA